jgi:hypothetical protein
MAAICFLVVGLITMFSEWEHNKTYNYDSFGYHNYLPSAIIYNDLGYYNHMDSIVSKYRPTGNKLIRYGLHPCENSDKLCNVTPRQSTSFFIHGHVLLLAHENKT